MLWFFNTILPINQKIASLPCDFSKLKVFFNACKILCKAKSEMFIHLFHQLKHKLHFNLICMHVLKIYSTSRLRRCGRLAHNRNVISGKHYTWASDLFYNVISGQRPVRYVLYIFVFCSSYPIFSVLFSGFMSVL